MPSLSQDAADVSAALGCGVRAFAPSNEFRHDLLLAEDPYGRRRFVKVFPTNSRSAARETAAARLIGHHLPAVVPALVADGVTRSGRPWLAYEWVDLLPFQPSRDNLYATGQSLARMHRITVPQVPAALPRYGSPVDLVAEKASLVEQVDPLLATRIRRLCDRLTPPDPPPWRDEPPVLLHGDFGWRNVSLTAEGTVAIFDFEHAAVGAPVLELAKLADRELNSDADRAAFLDGYAGVAPIDRTSWEAWLPLVRLWAAAGIIPYARETGDAEFEQHARYILDRLDSLTAAG